MSAEDPHVQAGIDAARFAFDSDAQAAPPRTRSITIHPGFVGTIEIREPGGFPMITSGDPKIWRFIEESFQRQPGASGWPEAFIIAALTLFAFGSIIIAALRSHT